MTLLPLVLLLSLPQDGPFSDPFADALARAKSGNRRVLIVWGRNDSAESVRLHALLAKDPALKKKLLYEYDVVYTSQLDLAKKHGADVSELPALTILAADGTVLSTEKVPALDDKKALLALLEKHQAKPWVAKDLYDAALKQAKDSKKRLFLHFGAPW